VTRHRASLAVASIVVALGAAVWFTVLRESNPCTILAERELFDTISDFDDSDPQPTMEEAVELAFVWAGTPREVDASDLDSVIVGDDNVVHVGTDGSWIMLASVPDGYVPVEYPRPCSILEE
jgi:hypothetical protein